jgi:exosortase
MPTDFERLYPLVFFSTVLALLALERVGALRRQPVTVATRWTSNIGLYIIGGLVAAVVLPIGIYAFARERPPGLVSGLEWPFVAQAALTFLLLDLWKYWEHRAFHGLPLLWRLHLVHHSDTAVDVTTTERHHPFEIAAGMLLMVAIVAALGLPAAALAMYLMTATVVALWSHANLRLPARLDRILRSVVVTPSVHATHHSDLRAETDSNFGIVLTVWDRLFGTYVDPERARIPHFGLAYFHRKDDTRLARVLQQPFLFRRNLAYPAREPEPAMALAAPRTKPFAGFTASPGARTALLAGAIGSALILLTMGSAALDMMATWRSSEAYQYAWLVLPMLVYVLGWHWDLASRPVDVRPGFAGVAVVAVAAVLWVAAALMNVDVGRQFALILAIQGVAMSTLGWQSYRRLFPALALLFLMIPAGDLLLSPLRALTVDALALFATLAGLPHRVDGFVIFIGTHRYIVIDECAGLAYMTLATFLGYSFGLLLYRTFAKVVALALVGAALGIVSNLLRVCAIVLIDWSRGSQMDLAAHGTWQWLGLLGGLCMLFYVLVRLVADPVPDAAAATPRGHATPARALAPIVAGLTGIVAVGGGAALQSGAAPLAQHPTATLSPPAIPGWGRAEAAPAWSVAPDGRSQSLRIVYQRDGRDVEVVIAETLSAKAKLPESLLVPGDGGPWREHRAEHERGCAGATCLAFRHATWRPEKSQRSRHVYATYAIGDYATDSRLALRAMQGWQRLGGGGGAPRLIVFVAEGDPLDANELATAYAALDAALGPASVLR